MSSTPQHNPYPASKSSLRTSNPIRLIVDQLTPPKDCLKSPIALSIGDPTRYGNLRTHPFVTNTLCKVITSSQFNGYPHSCGFAEARSAVAQHTSVPSAPLGMEDVILTSGASGALEIAIQAIADEGDNILLPCPGFSLYATLCENKGIEKRYYRLDPARSWEVDLDSLRAAVTPRTRAILINNPSNPCGSVYSLAHLQDIAAVARSLDLPVISDEIYYHMVFDPLTNPFLPLASVCPDLPVVAIGGIAKRFLVPGWRLGWILVHDRHGMLGEVAKGMKALTTLILGPNSTVQAALPAILSQTPQRFFDDTLLMLREHGELLFARLSLVRGLKPVRAQGTMYIMVQLEVDVFEEAISDDIQFAKLLYSEQNVCVLPGQVFGAPNFVRLVTCPSLDILQDACDRILEFCQSHYLS